MLHPKLAAAFENVHESNQVRRDVGTWILQRVPHTYLRGEVDHRRGAESPRRLHQLTAVRDINLLELESGPVHQSLQPGPLQLDVVVGRQRVDSENLIALAAVAESTRGSR